MNHRAPILSVLTKVFLAGLFLLGLTAAQPLRAQTPTIMTLNTCTVDADCADDGNLCTLEVCSSSFCTRRSLVEDDLVDCTVDECDPATGVTAHTPENSFCSDDNACTQDICTGTGNEPVAGQSGGSGTEFVTSDPMTAPSPITGCEYPAEIEVCDGFDNDCDREVDEGFSVRQPCTVGTGACAVGGTTICSTPLACPDGYSCARDDGTYCQLPMGPSNPTPEDPEGLQTVAIPEPTAEICDGIDNDCDGQTDDDCQLCGNGIVETGETCDGGTNLNGQPNQCNITCTGITPAVCGNLVVEEGEQCETNIVAGNQMWQCVNCRMVFRTPVCGNGLVEGTEECEAGVTELTADQECDACLIVSTAPIPSALEPQEPPPPVVPPQRVAVCGNGLMEGEEVCDEGVNNNDETEGACRTDCSSLVVAAGRTVPEPLAFQSEIFDGEKTCAVTAPFVDIDAATTLYPDDYERQFVVFAGHSGENAGFGFKASKNILADCRFSFDSCTADGAVWERLLAARLNDAEPNDLIGVTGENEYRYILDADQFFDNAVSGECRMPHQPVFHPEVPSGDRQWSAEDGATLCGEVTAIHDLKPAGEETAQTLILGAVVLRVDNPEPLTVVGLDIFRYNEGGFEHDFHPIQNFDPSVEINRVRIHAPEVRGGNLASVNFLIDTHIGSRSVDCNRTAVGEMDCTLGFEMVESPLLLIDEADVLRSSGLPEEETGEDENYLLIASDGTVYELEEEEEPVETEPAAAPEAQTEIGVDAATAPAPTVERETRRRHSRQSLGAIEEEDFNPAGEAAEAVEAWLEVGAYNMVLTEETAIRGYRVRYDEERRLQVEALETEIYTADSVLNNVHSNETVAYINPHRPFACLRNNFGGADLCAFFEVIDTATGEKLGTVFTVFDNYNEAPEITVAPLEPQGQRVFLRIHAADPMDDTTTCRASLIDSKGTDLSSLVRCDLENGTVEINLEGVVEEGSGISLDIIDGQTSRLELKLPNLFDWLIPAAHAQAQSGQTLNGTVCAADAGGAEGCSNFTITVGGGLTAQIPDGGGGTTTATSPQWGLQGGGLCGSIAQTQANFASSGGAAYLLMIFTIGLLILFRRQIIHQKHI